jgi:hypothetical protein
MLWVDPFQANFGDAIFIARLDVDGNFVWAQQPTSSDAAVFDNGAALALDSAGDVLGRHRLAWP